jgi:hypothetical protein
MPQLPPAEEKQNLHGYIQRLVGRFGRDAWFTVEDLYTCGGSTRSIVGDRVLLPADHVPGYLEELTLKGMVETRHEHGKPLEFRVTGNYAGLPDKITPQDIYKDKMSILANRLQTIAPNAYQKLARAEVKLLDISSDADVSEVGNLCVQCMEDFCEAMWDRLIAGQTKPAKQQIKNMLAPVVQFVGSKSSQTMQDALWGLFDANRDHIEKLKHRRVTLDVHHAKLAVLLTATLCEEVLYYFPDIQ